MSSRIGPPDVRRARAVRAANPPAPVAPRHAPQRAPAPRDTFAKLSLIVDGCARINKPGASEPLLSAHNRARLTRVLEQDPALSATTLALCAPLSPPRQALLLRAVAARLPQLADGRCRPAALRVLSSFQERLHSLGDAEALRRATSLDLDRTRNDSTLDAIALWSRRGVIHDTSHHDTAADNDGLFQRFTGACGPTVIQMMMAEADPVLAFTLHDEGLTSDETTGAIATFQREVLEAYGGIAIGRREAQLKARFNNALGRLSQKGVLTDVEVEAARAYALRGRGSWRTARPAIVALRAAYHGFPQKAELSRLRRRTWPPRDEGIGTLDYQKALHEHASPYTQAHYQPTNPPDGFARGQVWRHLDRLARCLQRGLDVPFGIAEPGHWMLACAVKGRKPKRSFLIADPDGGRTAWVTERDFVRGRFADTPFNLPDPGQRPYVDSILFPQGQT